MDATDLMISALIILTVAGVAVLIGQRIEAARLRRLDKLENWRDEYGQGPQR